MTCGFRDQNVKDRWLCDSVALVYLSRRGLYDCLMLIYTSVTASIEAAVTCRHFLYMHLRKEIRVVQYDRFYLNWYMVLEQIDYWSFQHIIDAHRTLTPKSMSWCLSTVPSGPFSSLAFMVMIYGSFLCLLFQKKFNGFPSTKLSLFVFFFF